MENTEQAWQVQVGTMRKWKSAILWLAGLTVVGALITWIAVPKPPDAAARKYYDESLNGNLSVKQRICSAKLVEAPAADLIVAGGKMLGIMLGYSVDTSGLSFQIIEKGRDTAKVVVTGSYTQKLGLFSYAETVKVNETVLMVRENHRWKWCGSATP